MKGKNLRELFKKNVTKTGAVMLAAALVLGSAMWASNQSGSVPELTTFVDNPESVEIDADETPLSNVKVKTTSKTTKKTKKVKLKKKAMKTYSKKSATKKKTTTSKKQTKTETITTKTVVASSMTSSFKKGSNINTQVTTTKTTVTTTTVEKSNTAVKTASTVPNGEIDLSKAAPKLNKNIADAYSSLNFKVKIDSGVPYSGLFDARTQSITLRKLDDTVYHELGHFVAFAAGNVDTSAAFQQIFAQEKSKYTDYNKAYVLSNSSEYFAESFKNYTLDPAGLKSSRPLTYEAIEKAVAAVTPEQTAKMKMFYGAIWS